MEKSNQSAATFEGTDPKVLQFLSILEEYRVKCESEGNYLEAARAHKQLGVLRQQEEKRQQKVIQARHISERQDVQAAHQMQYQEFSRSWDKYIEEYDQMAQMYIQQMTERHALVLLEYQKKLREELANKPPKWSKTLMDQRRKQHINARNKNYLMAQKLKKISDLEEMKEREEMEQNQTIIFIRKETKFRQQQQSELQALLKRIEYRRKEHIVQREIDTKRLLQRNKNVQNVLENKQNQEENKLFNEIKKNLYSSSILYVANGGASIRNKTSTGNIGSTGTHTQSQTSGSDRMRNNQRASSGGNNNSALSSSTSSAFNLPNIKSDQEMMSNNPTPPGFRDTQENEQVLGNHNEPESYGKFTSLVYDNEEVEDDSLESYA